MQDQFSRLRMQIGPAAVRRLQEANVAVFGLGGVGGHCAEALARAGIGRLTLVDRDTVTLSNLNRQIVALHSTLGRNKADVMRERVLDINPDCAVTARCVFYLPETADTFDLSQFDYVADCMDTVAAKLELCRRCCEQDIPVISCMGAANKLDPAQLAVTDISKTQNCPLARVMRKELRNRGITHLKVVSSVELPCRPVADPADDEAEDGGRRPPSSNSFVPAVAGLMLAGQIIRDLAGVAGTDG